MILVIDNYDSFTYNLVALIKCCTDMPVKVLRNDAVDRHIISTLNPEALIISPGPCSPSEAGYSVDAVRDFRGKLPILGICLGHQSIGAAYGADITKARVIMHGCIDNMLLSKDALFSHLPAVIQGTRYHSLAIDPQTLPDTLVPIAYSATDQSIMAVRDPHHPVFGLQFHPESYGTSHGKTIMTNFIGLIDTRPTRRLS